MSHHLLFLLPSVPINPKLSVSQRILAEKICHVIDKTGVYHIIQSSTTCTNVSSTVSATDTTSSANASLLETSQSREPTRMLFHQMVRLLFAFTIIHLPLSPSSWFSLCLPFHLGGLVSGFSNANANANTNLNANPNVVWIWPCWYSTGTSATV